MEEIEIDVNDPEDLSFWSEQFEITEAELRKAIEAVGNSVDAITQYLQQ